MQYLRAHFSVVRGWLRTTALAAALLGPHLAGADDGESARPGAQTASNNVIEEFRIEEGGDLPLVSVTVHGRSYKFMLDTGCTRTVMDESFRGELEDTGEIVIANGTMEVPVCECEDACVGATRIEFPRRVLAADLSALRRGCGGNLRGLLGMDFLRGQVVQIDFDAGRVLFLRSSDGIPGARFGIAYDAGRAPTIAGRAGPRDVSFAIDTGAFRLHLSGATFDALVQSGDIVDVAEAEGFTLAGPDNRRLGTLSAVSVGDFRHMRKSVATWRPDENALGLEYLCRFRVTFDFPRGILIFEEGNECYEFEPENECGLELEANESDIVVTQASPDGTAHRAGVRAGDRLLAIGRRSVRGMTVFAANRRIARTTFPDSVQLTIQTPGQNPRKTRMEMLLRPGAPAGAPPTIDAR